MEERWRSSIFLDDLNMQTAHKNMLEALGKVPRRAIIPDIPEGAAAPWLVLQCASLATAPRVVVTGSSRELDRFWMDASTLAQTGKWDVPIWIFPALGSENNAREADIVGQRLNTLQQLCRLEDEDHTPPIILTCIQALLEPVISKSEIRRSHIELKVGAAYDLDALTTHFSKQGYDYEAEVLGKGQAARRGGILDVWPPTEAYPVRLEFFGDELESIRLFAPEDQRSIEKRGAITFSPASETAGESENAAFFDYLPASTHFFWADPEAIFHSFSLTYSLAHSKALLTPEELADEFKAWLENGAGQSAGHQILLGHLDRLETDEKWHIHPLELRPLEKVASLSHLSAGLDLLEAERRKCLAQYKTQAGQGWTIHLYFNSESSKKRFSEVYGAFGKIKSHIAPLSEGFIYPAARYAVIAEADIMGIQRNRLADYRQLARTQKAERKKTKKRVGGEDIVGERLTDWTDLRPGEYVVHIDHGIGRYLGLYEIRFDGQLQEALTVEYAEGARLYVPTGQSHLLSRYIGPTHTKPQVHTLGGKRWLKEKVAAERAAHDLAAQMLETQARRNALEGHAFAPDSHWQFDFDATFPWVETADQLRAIDDVKHDMEATKPMDRLICGDAGYGKTEVAMRAAFKAVMDGKQVALLTPTTVLAQQHYETFSARMVAFPVRVEVLSRFRTPKEQQATLARVKSGETDIVIGTHRLLQKDVHFSDLGLVIIDEEQRFGVAAKEYLKKMRELSDVLTMSATPIPRTLYMSLTGARDMSVIQTPPRERLPIETIIAQDNDALIRDAILKELQRGGQVFYLHNRVQTIEWVHDRLKKIVPEARVGVGHGQMKEKELSKVMHQFIQGEFDVLLCTTIIESGVDIPNVNTILIDRADRFGMAELYQLRGRVGRYKHQAYAYLLLPRHGHLFSVARKRIGAVKRYSSLGSGFKLALRDLEIRGAGNLLGAEQSGHIAAVGFDLYCQLLNRTVSRLKGEAPRPIIEVDIRFDFLEMTPDPDKESEAAVIPRRYIEDENQRIGLYRKIASIAYESEIAEIEAEFRDRFGPVPASIKRLLMISRIRLTAAKLGLQRLETKENRLLLHKGRDQYWMLNGRHPRLHQHGADARLEEILKVLNRLAKPR